jgi:hypothetical protein
MRPDPGAAGAAPIYLRSRRRALGADWAARRAEELLAYELGVDRVTQDRTLGCDDGLTRGRDGASLRPVLRLDDECVHGRISSSNRSARSSSGTV